jgi:NAD-dependent SIR2 family protein deacetylase
VITAKKISQYSTGCDGLCYASSLSKRPKRRLAILSSQARSVSHNHPERQLIFTNVTTHVHLRCLNAKPNDAHRALATLSLPAVLSRVAPCASSPPLHVAQNIDALSLRVLEPFSSQDKATAEKSLLEMHGSIFVTRCTSCQHIQRSYTPALSSALRNLEDINTKHDIPIKELPRCGGDAWAGSNRYGNCGGLLRPEVVWFNEVPPLMGEIARKMNWCDLLLVVGTSFTVSCNTSRQSVVASQLTFGAGIPRRGFCVAG